MKIKKQDLLRAAASGICTRHQAEQLWTHLEGSGEAGTRFDVEHIAYYFGTLVIIIALTWFANEAFIQFLSAGLMAVAAGYFLLFWGIGHRLHQKKATLVPGGLLLTASVFLVPLFVFSVQTYFDLWVNELPGSFHDFVTWLRGGWFFMEITTILAASAFLYHYRFPFMTMPLAFALWLLSLDATPLLFSIEEYTQNQMHGVSILFGVAMLACATAANYKVSRDSAFWLYFFGLLSFWGGITGIGYDSQLAWLAYFCINTGLILLSALLQRRTFIVFGATGVYLYLYHLSSTVFEDSILFPIVLSLLGLSIVWLGILYRKHEPSLMNRINALVPERISGYLHSKKR
ncbi:MAG: hypothetical protein WD266_02480 [Balneolales bacterium]